MAQKLRLQGGSGDESRHIDAQKSHRPDRLAADHAEQGPGDKDGARAQQGDRIHQRRQQGHQELLADTQQEKATQHDGKCHRGELQLGFEPGFPVPEQAHKGRTPGVLPGGGCAHPAAEGGEPLADQVGSQHCCAQSHQGAGNVLGCMACHAQQCRRRTIQKTAAVLKKLLDRMGQRLGKGRGCLFRQGYRPVSGCGHAPCGLACQVADGPSQCGRSADRQGAQEGKSARKKGQDQGDGYKNRRMAPPVEPAAEKIHQGLRSQRSGESQQKREKKRV